jgi:hypothetical protein
MTRTSLKEFSSSKSTKQEEVEVEEEKLNKALLYYAYKMQQELRWLCQ